MHEPWRRQGPWSRLGESLAALIAACGIAAGLAWLNVGSNQWVFLLMGIAGFYCIVRLFWDMPHWLRWTLGFGGGLLFYVIWWFVFHHQLIALTNL